MAKRFTDTEKWEKPWFLNLKPQYKILWIYLLDNCDNAGFITFKPLSWQESIGEKYTVEGVEEVFKSKIIKMYDGRYWIPKFIQFQYPNGLYHNVAPHKQVISLLEKYKIDWRNENRNFIYKINNMVTLKEGLLNSNVTFEKGLQDKDKDKDKDKDTNLISNRTSVVKHCTNIKGIFSSEIEKLYKEFYPRKIGKEQGLRRLNKDIRTQDDLEQFKIAIKFYSNYVQGKEEKYIKHFSSFVSVWKDYFLMAEKKPKEAKIITDWIHPIFENNEGQSEY